MRSQATRRALFALASAGIFGCGEVRGGDSRVPECGSSNACAAGTTCSAGHCVPMSTGAGGAGQGGSPSGDGSGGRTSSLGTGGRTEATRGMDASNGAISDAGARVRSVDASLDGPGAAVDARVEHVTDATTDHLVPPTKPPCVVVDPPTTCGVLSPWIPRATTGPWTYLHAGPIEGEDGFAAVFAYGDPSIDDYDTFVLKVPTTGGCSEFLSPPLASRRALVGVRRAVSNGGTVAVLTECIERFPCGNVVFVNGAEWVDSSSTAPSRILDVMDVAPNGNVFVVSHDEDLSADGTVTPYIIERWLSPSRAILAERKVSGVPDTPVDVALLDDGTIALAFQSDTATPTPPVDYIQYQNAQFDVLATWQPPSGRRIDSVRARSQWLGITGVTQDFSVWFALQNGETRATLWTKTRTDKAYFTTAEVTAAGAMNVLGLIGATYLIPHASDTVTPDATAPLTNVINAVGGTPIGPAVVTQSDGTILWASAPPSGTYCDPAPTP